MNSDELKPYILEVMKDGRSLNGRWIKHKLDRMGIETNVQTIRTACEKLEKDGKLINLGKFAGRTEWRSAVC
jgi:hypothetical protein